MRERIITLISAVVVIAFVLALSAHQRQEIEGQLKVKDELIEEMTVELNGVQEEVKSLLGETKALKEEAKSLQENNSKLRTRVKDFEIQIKSLIDQNESLKIENKKLKENLGKTGNKPIEPKSSFRTVNATAYVANCKPVTINGRRYGGCSGITALGDNVKNNITYNGLRIVAVDPRYIPLNTKMEIEFKDGTTVQAIARDTGGYIKGNKIDYLVGSESEAYKFGKQKAKVRIIEWG